MKALTHSRSLLCLSISLTYTHKPKESARVSWEGYGYRFCLSKYFEWEKTTFFQHAIASNHQWIKENWSALQRSSQLLLIFGFFFSSSLSLCISPVVKYFRLLLFQFEKYYWCSASIRFTRLMMWKSPETTFVTWETAGFAFLIWAIDWCIFNVDLKIDATRTILRLFILFWCIQTILYGHFRAFDDIVCDENRKSFNIHRKCIKNERAICPKGNIFPFCKQVGLWPSFSFLKFYTNLPFKEKSQRNQKRFHVIETKFTNKSPNELPLSHPERKKKYERKSHKKKECISKPHFN